MNYVSFHNPFPYINLRTEYIFIGLFMLPIWLICLWPCTHCRPFTF